MNHVVNNIPSAPNAWSEVQLERIGVADELRIAARRTDGTMPKRVPIWVVSVDGQVYVRTGSRRETGWFGQVLDSGRARVSVPGLEVDVTVEEVGADDADQRANVDGAYRGRYGRYGRSTVGVIMTDEAAATTLRLEPEVSLG
jgi:hypothetical protein